MLDNLTGLYVLLVVFGVAAMIILTINDQKRRIAELDAEADALAAERDAALQQVQTILGSYDEVTRKKVLNHINRSIPHPKPPPGLKPLLEKLYAQWPDNVATDLYAFGCGWEITRNNPGVVITSLSNTSLYYSGHMLITGETSSGKGHLAFLLLAQLCYRTTTDQLKIFCIDPKQDSFLWEGKAHNWREPVLGRNRAQITAAMEALRAERERRDALRARYRVLEWQELPDQARPPMLLVYISELDGLKLGCDDLDEWMTTELGMARASGIRYLIDVQNVSNRETSWRTHIGTFFAGFQSSRDSVRPNCGMTVEELRERGAIPPNELDGPGYFTVRSGKGAITVRAPKMDLAERNTVLARLPDGVAPSVLDAPPARVGEADGGVAAFAAERQVPKRIAVTDAERAVILAAAQRLDSRRKVCLDVFGSTGGTGYEKVRLVCDEAGVLIGSQVAETA
jgi:hypothetical protein